MLRSPFGGVYAAIGEFEQGNIGWGLFNLGISVADAITSKTVGSALSKLVKGGRLIPGSPGMVIRGEAKILRANMGKLPPHTQAHHLIPSQLWKHPVLQKMGMDMNHISNGMALPDTIHRGFHSIYNEAMEIALDQINQRNLSVRDMQGAVLKLQNRARALIEGGLPLYLKKGGTLDDWIKGLTQ